MSENSVEKVIARLAKRAEYTPNEMLADIYYLLDREKRNAEIYEEALRHPDSSKKIEAAGVMIMQRQYNLEMRAHKDTKWTLDILQEKHTNLQEWIRDKGISNPEVLKVMETLSPRDMEEFLKWKRSKK